MKTLDLIEAADFLKCERSHTLSLAGAGQLPGAKIGRSWVFLEEDLAEYLRAEVRRQMRERQVEAVVMDGLSASAARTPPMVVSPRAAGRGSKKGQRFDLSGFNEDGTPKLLNELVAKA